MTCSSLFDKHKDFGALFGDSFAWQVPQKYSEIEEEYSAARRSAVVMERPYFGHLHITGRDHADLLHRLTTNELRFLKTGEGQINVFANEKGRIIDRVILHKFSDSVRLITSPSNDKKVADWIEKYIFTEDVKVENLTSVVTTISVFGPECPQLLGNVFSADLSGRSDRHHRETNWREQTIVVSRTNELGIPGFDITVAINQATELWEELIAKGKQFALIPMGELAYQTLRIEAGWPTYGIDFDEEINPHEAGMLSFINFNKGCYIGQEVIARLDTYDKVQKHLMGVILEGKVSPKSKDPILVESQEAGYITSVCFSIGMQREIALGYVRTKFANDGTEVQVGSAETACSGRLAKLPFKL